MSKQLQRRGEDSNLRRQDYWRNGLLPETRRIEPLCHLPTRCPLKLIYRLVPWQALAEHRQEIFIKPSPAFDIPALWCFDDVWGNARGREAGYHATRLFLVRRVLLLAVE
jgi:hypothetical protein